MKLRQRLTLFVKKLNHTWLGITVALVVLGGACAWSGLAASKQLTNNADALVNVYMAAAHPDVQNDSIFVQNQHTLLAKFPIFFLQSQFDYNTNNFYFFNIVLLLITAIGWCVLCASMLGKKTLPIICLGFAAVILAAPILATDITYTTVRNIEFVAALAFIVALVRFLRAAKRPKKFILLITSVLYAVFCIASDGFFVYIYTLGILAGLSFLWLREEQNTAKKQIMLAALLVVCATALGYVIKIIAHQTGMLYIDSTDDAPLQTVRWDLLAPSVWQSTAQLLSLFGADIFNKNLTLQNMPYFLNFGLLTMAIAGYGLFLRRPKASKTLTHFIYLLLAVTTINFLSYIIGDRVFTHNDGTILGSGGERYLVNAVLILLIGLGLLWIQRGRLQQVIQYAMTGLLLASITVSMVLAPAAYARIHNVAQARISPYLTLARVLEKENVLFIASGHWYGATTKFWYDQTTAASTSLQFAHMKDCNVPATMLSRSSWSMPSPSVQRSAIVIENGFACDPAQLKKLYGQPANHYALGDGKQASTIELYIYNYDIRSKMPPALPR